MAFITKNELKRYYSDAKVKKYQVHLEKTRHPMTEYVNQSIQQGKKASKRGKTFKPAKRRRPPKPITKKSELVKNEGVPTILEHWSPKSNLSHIVPGSEKSTDISNKGWDLDNKLSFFYPAGATPEPQVANKAASKYTVHLDPEHSIYNLNKDPEGFKQKVKEENQGAFNVDMLINKLKDAGHHGMHFTAGDYPMVAMFHPTKVHQEEAAFGKGEFSMKKSEYFITKLAKASRNVREQRQRVFGRASQPSAKSPMREKHMEHIRDFTRKRYGLEMKPAGGKVDPSTGDRRDPEAEVTPATKPDWRSGELEAQPNPEAMVHEMGHLDIMPKGLGLEEGQTHMDKEYAEAQKQHGYMSQKRTQGEVQPMAVEQLLRRRMGLPSSKVGIPAKEGDPPRTAADTGDVIGTRVPKGKTSTGEQKFIDYIRQSRFLSPENRERVDMIDRGELVYDPKHGWVRPDISDKQGLRQNIDKLINVRAREKAKDPRRKDVKTLMRSERKSAFIEKLQKARGEEKERRKQAAHDEKRRRGEPRYKTIEIKGKKYMTPDNPKAGHEHGIHRQSPRHKQGTSIMGGHVKDKSTPVIPVKEQAKRTLGNLRSAPKPNLPNKKPAPARRDTSQNPQRKRQESIHQGGMKGVGKPGSKTTASSSRQRLSESKQIKPNLPKNELGPSDLAYKNEGYFRKKLGKAYKAEVETAPMYEDKWPRR